jgi:hypothetical protein
MRKRSHIIQALAGASLAIFGASLPATVRAEADQEEGFVRSSRRRRSRSRHAQEGRRGS